VQRYEKAREMQKENKFFFSFPSASTFECSSKVRKSERNAKGKQVFLALGCYDLEKPKVSTLIFTSGAC